jgi:Tfp pilus assembly protein PilF
MRGVVLLVGGLAMVASGVSSPAWAARATGKKQLSFGTEMAARGLWAEAHFRFVRADTLEPNNPRTLNNLAVASEALGRFEEAVGYYRRALELSPSDRDIRSNYDRFLGFYEAFRARQESQKDTPGEASAPAPATPQAAPTPPVAPNEPATEGGQP